MNNVKKIISSLLVAVIILTAAPLNGFAGLKLNFDWFDFSTKSSAEEKELAPTGQCGENVYWTFDKDTGLLTISGSGSMYDTKSSFQRNYLIKTVVIENGVTSIGDSAFPNCTGLTSITIPDSVTSIGNYAIFGCKGLTSIKIPNSVTFIGESAFAYCRGLTSITISDNITSINICTFEGCTGLKELTMPCSAEVGAYSFDQCVNIKKITLTKGTGKMNDFNTNPKLNSNYYAYTPWYLSKENIKEILLEDGITSIGNYAFKDCTGLTSITIPDSVTSIGNSAFFGCTGLTSITIPDGITSISDSTFSGCTGLKSIKIPDSVTRIGDYVFKDCTGLKELTMPCLAEFGVSPFVQCTNIEKVTLTKGIGEMYYNLYSPWYISKDSIKEIILEDGITGISYSAFKGCTGLKSIKIPDSVTGIGSSAFYGCTGLTSITIPDGITSISDSTFYGCTGLTSIMIPDSVTRIGDYAFKGCTGLKELTMPCSAEIGVSSFDQCTNIEKVTLTKGTGEMYNYGFNRISTPPWYISKDNIKEITLEYGITGISYSAFKGCTGLKSIKIPDSVTSIGSSAFYGCTGLTSITIPDGITSISNSTFSGCTGLTSITIPDSVTSIGSSAFSGCTGLTSITIPDSVTSIGSSAFSGCTGLTSLTIPDKVTNIGSSAFFGCTGLTGITIPDSVTNIGDSTFYGCTGLTGITIPDSVTSIDNYAFSSCSGLTNVKIPDSVTSIGSSAFSGCTGLTSITIPDSVTSIGSSAFQGCTGLTSITIPDSVTSISSRAFYDCKTIYYNAKNAITDSSAFYSAEKIIVGDTVQTIPNAFARGCDNIKSITISSSVVKVGNDAFNHCDNLESVTFMGDNRIEMGSNIFEYCNKLKIHCKDNSFIAAYAEMNNLTYSIIDDDGNPEYDIKNGMILSYNGNDKNLFVSSGTKIGFGAFENNFVITDVELSSIVTKIYNKAFANCTNLSKIIIPQSVASIGDNAFEGCDQLTIWCYAGSYAEAYAINHDIPVKYINLQLNENSIKLNTNESVNLCASFNTELSDEIELIWTSDNPSVVTVTSDGRITAVGKGKATITATSSTGLYATCVVNVDTVEQEKPRVNSVKIDDISLNYKKSTTLKPTIKADDGAKYKVEYSTSNAKVATVDKNGKVTATKRGSGTATITCTVTDEFGNTVTDTCNVNVKLSFGQILITYVLFGWIWY